MKYLIVNADDFGYCEAVNYGILKAFSKGIVRSTTMMANMPGFEHAVSLAKENSTLGVGVHLTLTCYKPLLKTHKTLVNEQGYFDKKNKDNFDANEIYNEWKAQITRVQDAGIQITHLDSHHHVHTNEKFRAAFERIRDEYQLPVRGGFTYDVAYEPKTELFGKFYMQNVNVNFLKEFLSNLEDDKIYDMMCHPAYVDKFLYDSSSYALQRIEELDVLTSEEVKTYIEKNDIQLINYRVYDK